AGSLQQLISQTMVHWAQEAFIQSPELVRAMFSLLHRQYDGLGELVRALPRAYSVSAASLPDTCQLLECLGQIRSLLIVQMGPEEENLMIQSIGWRLHPAGRGSSFGDRQQRVGTGTEGAGPGEGECQAGHHPSGAPWVTSCPPWSHRDTSPRVPWHGGARGRSRHGSGRPPQPRAHPAPCLPKPCAHPALCPQVVTYLASCGLQSCPMLLAKGYPDLGWNPCGGQRYLDFLRFAVFVNGESVEENANVVVRLLIR
ncbi:RYR1 protein, partial [Psilopogon haemacephalus]|nr:RYR1 protein [Psilopogon haemacephalus]